MQTRFWLATKNDIRDAYQYKTDLLEKDPDRNIQIRKGRDGGREVFRVVERFNKSETKVINDTKRTNKRAKRGKRKSSVNDLSWASS